jgi:WD40 repeat protein
MFSNHSHFIAAGSSDCLVKIWDMKNHKQVYSTIKSHVGQVTSLSWIKNSGIEKGPEILASSSTIGDIFLHSIKTSNIIETLNAKNQ